MRDQLLMRYVRSVGEVSQLSTPPEAVGNGDRLEFEHGDSESLKSRIFGKFWCVRSHLAREITSIRTLHHLTVFVVYNTNNTKKKEYRELG